MQVSISAWVQTATGDLAHEGADYIRMNYLRGQALNMRTGLTYRLSWSVLGG